MKDKLTLKCECIDSKTISDLKIALVQAKRNYENYAKAEEGKVGRPTTTSIALISKAKEFHILLSEITKITPCPEH